MTEMILGDDFVEVYAPEQGIQNVFPVPGPPGADGDPGDATVNDHAVAEQILTGPESNAAVEQVIDDHIFPIVSLPVIYLNARSL